MSFTPWTPHNPNPSDPPSGEYGRAELMTDANNEITRAEDRIVTDEAGEGPLVTTLATAGHPTSGTWKTGQSVVDSNGVTWNCTAGGTPGTWVQSALVPGNNLSDLGSASTARSNLGLGSAATEDASAFASTDLSNVDPATGLAALGGVPNAATQTQETTSQWTFTPNQESTPANFESRFTTETYGSPAVTETCWSWGYNINQGDTGQCGAWWKILPNCGDVDALEMEFYIEWPNGAKPTQALMCAANLGTPGALTWRFDTGSGTQGNNSFFSITADNGSVNVLNASAAKILSYVPIEMSTAVNVSSVLTIANGGGTAQNTISFERGGTAYWYFYDAGSTNLFLRDMVNNLMLVEFVSGAGTAGYVATAGSFVNGLAALATTATTGFLYIPSCPGVPTGVPAPHTGTVPLVYDTTDNRLYIYNSGWQEIAA